MRRRKATSVSGLGSEKKEHIDILQSCRVCMVRHRNMKPLFDQKASISERIRYCTGVVLTQEKCLSSYICRRCLENLSIAHQFKTQCLESYQIYQNLLENQIKTEDLDYNEFNDLTEVIYNENDLDDKIADLIKLKDVKICRVNSSKGINISTDIGNDEFKKKSDVEQDLNCNLKTKGMRNNDKNDSDLRNDDKIANDNDFDVVNDEINADTDFDGDEGVWKEENQPLFLKRQNLSLPKRQYKKSGKPRKKTKFVKPIFKCLTCNLKFHTKEESLQHKKDTHNDQELWICEVCGKQFNRRATHYNHVKQHLPPKHACDWCDYKTTFKHDLAKHIRVHTGVKLYHCHLCTQSYRTTSNLHQHIERLHEQVKRFQCTMCDKQFYDKTKLNRHLDSHNEIKRHECEICHSCFTRRCYWKKHLERQHGVVIPPQRPGRKKMDMHVSFKCINSIFNAGNSEKSDLMQTVT